MSKNEPFLSPEQQEATEQQLRAALEARTSTVEPADDSYLRLQHRLKSDAPTRFRTPERRYLAVAALLLVTAGGIALALRQIQLNEVQATGQTTTVTAPPTTNPAVTSTAVSTTTQPAVATTLAPLAVYEPTTIAGPRRATPEDAAHAFLDLVGANHAGVEIDGMVGRVRSFTPDGDVGDFVVELDIVEAALSKGEVGYMVVAARGAPTITSPATGSDNMISPLVVAGTGEGFEGWLGIRLVSAVDGRVLAESGAFAGNFGQEAPYAAEIEVEGAEWAWIIVTSSVGADNVLPSFSAIPISYNVGVSEVEYLVVGIDGDDPDGGLNIRTAPLDGEVVATVPEGTTGLQRKGRVPAVVNGEEWWNIEVTIDGGVIEGWVNRRYLLDRGTYERRQVSDADLVDIGRRFAEAGVVRDIDQLVSLPWADSDDIPVGWFGAMQTLTADELRTSDFWTESRQWGVPEELDGPYVDLSFLSLLEVPDPTLDQVNYELDLPVSPYPLDQEAADQRFGSIRRVTIVNSDVVNGDGETPWRTTTLFVEQADTGPVIVGVGSALWLP